MRRFINISTLSSRRKPANFHRHLNAFSGSTTTVVSDDTLTPPRKLTSHVINMQKHLRFMSSSHTNNKSNIKSESEGGEAIRIQVMSREHIKPSSPTPQNLRYYKLSMFDQIEAPIYHPLMFFYLNPVNINNNDDNKNMSIDEIISYRSNRLKESLSETLTRMYPFAGKLGSELHIDCNDIGVYYIETRVDDRLDNVLKKPDNKLLKRLLPVVDSVPNQPLSGSYVSMVQVNFFNCGGVSITVQHNHKLADGYSTMIFMNTWAAIARRDPNQPVHPSFDSSSMFPQNPQVPSAPYVPLWYLTISPAYLKHGQFETKRFVFDALALRELKARASKHQPVSRVLAVMALLWKCVTTETPSKPSVLHMPVDIRKRFSPPLPDSSIGNIKSGALVRFDPDATSSNLEVASMASQLKKEIANITSESIEELRRENAYVGFAESLRNSMEMLTDFGTEYYLTSSMCNSGTKEVDFGWGKPVWFCTGNHLNEDIPVFTNRMLLIDSCSGDGIEAWVTLEKQVMDAVKCNPELLSFASVDTSPLQLNLD